MASKEGYAVALGVGLLAGLGAWWLLRRRATDEQRLPTPKDSESVAEFGTPVGKVSRLFVYPVKSCHRIEVDSSHCGIRGLRYDRCWVIVTREGRFVNSRWMPRCMLIQPRLEFPGWSKGGISPGSSEGGVAPAWPEGEVVLHLTAPDMPELVVCEPPRNATPTLVRVWALKGEGVDVGDEASQWVSRFLQLEGCRMYFMAPHNRGRVLTEDPSFGEKCSPGEESSFADFTPLLLASESAVEELNKKIETPLEITRFRPNIVVSGCSPHAEDGWGEVKIGDRAIIRGIKPCARCKMTRAHPEEGYFTGAEPIQTLKTYRTYEAINGQKHELFGTAPLFGNNCVVVSPGDVHVGDVIYAKSTQ